MGCSQSPAPDVLDLMLPKAEDFGVQRIQHKSVLVPDKRGVGAQSAEAMAVLTAQNIQSSAYFKYWLNDKQAFKVRINVYSDAKARDASWTLRYPADSLQGTQSLEVGERSFLKADKIGAFAVSNAVVEISSSKGAENLEGFIRAYASYVQAQYQK